MNVKRIWVKASCAAGWARSDKFGDAVREMARHSRGYVDPAKMTLKEFLEAVDDQRIGLVLVERSEGEDGGSAFRDFGCLGDRYNDAKVIS